MPARPLTAAISLTSQRDENRSAQQALDDLAMESINQSRNVGGVGGVATGIMVTPHTANFGEVAVAGTVVDLVDATAGAVTVTLPAAAGNQAQITVKKVDATVNAVTLVGTGGELVDGGASMAINRQNDALTVVSNGTSWSIV